MRYTAMKSLLLLAFTALPLTACCNGHTGRTATVASKKAKAAELTIPSETVVSDKATPEAEPEPRWYEDGYLNNKGTPDFGPGFFTVKFGTQPVTISSSHVSAIYWEAEKAMTRINLNNGETIRANKPGLNIIRKLWLVAEGKIGEHELGIPTEEEIRAEELAKKEAEINRLAVKIYESAGKEDIEKIVDRIEDFMVKREPVKSEPKQKK